VHEGGWTRLRQGGDRWGRADEEKDEERRMREAMSAADAGTAELDEGRREAEYFSSILFCQTMQDWG
jgi:hypothetical protein